METIKLSSWADFRSNIQRLRSRCAIEYDALIRREEILFRGQADSDWKIETTLERFDKRSWSLAHYTEKAHRCATEIEAHLGRKWDMIPWADQRKWFDEHFDSLRMELAPGTYEYWAYLRHHGFPSPLLDWTYSPYIAAFFALESQCDAPYAAVFAYIETPNGGKMSSEGESHITRMGPYLSAHRRHFIQQCDYTIATISKREQRLHYIAPHESVFEREDPEQDILVKLLLPRGERIAILKELLECNISHFTLFQSDEALARTLAFKEIEAPMTSAMLKVAT